MVGLSLVLLVPLTLFRHALGNSSWTGELTVGRLDKGLFNTSWCEGDDLLLKIILQYDVIFLQIESPMDKIGTLLDQLNSLKETGEHYNAVVSKWLGQNSSRAQYAYVFRTDRVEIRKIYQYEDKEDVFEREPYGVLVKSLFNIAIPRFFLLGFHIHPRDMLSEMNFMDNVYKDAVKYFGVSDAIIMGDMNADCSYLSHIKQANLDMVKSSHFKLITINDLVPCSRNKAILAGNMDKYVRDNKVETLRHAVSTVTSHRGQQSDLYGFRLAVKNSELDEEKFGVHSVRVRREATDTVTGTLEVAAFNIRIFGVSKNKKEDVVIILSQIVRRYDIILIQEIRDISQTVIVDFTNRVNQDARSEGVTYCLVLSERLGRTSSREQYAYLYRNDTVQVLGSHQYNDSAMDVFEREPFSVLIRSIKLDIPDTILIGLHSRPSDVQAELNQMVDVYEDAVTHFNTTNALILGDLNADCSFLSQTRYKSLRLVTDSRFTWLINSTVDTTISASDCAYDRFIVAGPIRSYIPANSAQVFRYDLAYSLSQDLTEEVSDHYPIECVFKGNLRIQSASNHNISSLTTSAISDLLMPLTSSSMGISTTQTITSTDTAWVKTSSSNLSVSSATPVKLLPTSSVSPSTTSVAMSSTIFLLDLSPLLKDIVSTGLILPTTVSAETFSTNSVLSIAASTNLIPSVNIPTSTPEAILSTEFDSRPSLVQATSPSTLSESANSTMSAAAIPSPIKTSLFSFSIIYLSACVW